MRGAVTAMAIVFCVCGVAADPKLDDEIRKLDKDYADAYGKQEYVTAQRLAKKLYDLQVKATGAGSEEAERRLVILGATYVGAGDYVNAEKTDLAYLKAMEKRHGAETQPVLDAVRPLVAIYGATGRYEDMEPLYQRMLAITKKLHGEKSEEYADELSRYGGLLQMQHLYAPAQRSAEKALQIYEAHAKGKDETVLVDPIRFVAWVYWQNNQPTKAIAAYDRAIKIATSSKTMRFESKLRTIWQTGESYFHGGRKDLATPLFDKAIAMAEAEISRLEKSKAKADEAQLQSLLGELGSMFRGRHDYAKAEASFSRAFKFAQKTGTPSSLEISLADAKRMQGKNKEALELIEKQQTQLAKIAPAGADGLSYFVAEILKEMGQNERAITAIDKYVAAQQKQWGKKNAVYGNAAYAAANIYARAGKRTDAERFLGEYLDVGERELGKVLRSGSEADHTTYFQRNAYVLNNAINFQLNFAPKSTPAIRLALTTLLRRKGRLLDAAAATLAAIRTKLSAADRKLLDELASMRAQLAKLSVAGSQGLSNEDLAKRVAALEERVQQLEAEIAKKSAAYAAVTQPIELAAIQKKIPADGRLVEIVNYQPIDGKITYAQLLERKFKPRRYGAYVLGPKGDPVYIELGESAPIDEAVANLRKALADPDNDQSIDLGNALYKLTFAKIGPKLGSATNILIAPDGVLNVVPFAALADDKQQLLIKKFTFTYLTSGRDLLRLSAKTRNAGGGVIFADPSFDKSSPASSGTTSRGRRSSDLASLQWPQLPGTGAEADAVVKTFKGLKVYRGDAATEGALKVVKGPPILHLATHGFFLPDEPEPPPPSAGGGAVTSGGTVDAPENPLLRSGLVLAGANKLASGDDDGLLTALEASSLDLLGTQLVVLSACETGVGKVTNGDGVYGLRRSIILAGAESLVMSLWQVDDFATKELMSGFYNQLAAGTPRGEALRAVQLELLAKPKYAHPFYWAAFVPAGATSPLK